MNTLKSVSRLVPTLACGLAMGAPALAQTTVYTLDADKAEDRLGACARAAGDVNNDGRPDFIVGAPETGNVFFSGEGFARVYSGATGSPIWTFNGVAIDDGFGTCVDGIGDVNNDGFADLAVGAPFVINAGSVRGAVTVFSGKTGGVMATLFGPSANDQMGHAVAGAGDVNNDNVPDLIVGAPFSASGGSLRGKAIVYSGATGGVLYTVLGVANNEHRGVSVDGIGDVNNDGFDDFVVGSYVGAKVFSGATGGMMTQFTGVQDDRMGVSVAGAGDVNGDLVPDILVGAPQDVNFFVPGKGYAKVFSGAGFGTLLTLTGDTEGDRFGWSVASAGDTNGDSRADVLVGADQASGGGNGYVRLFSGNGGGVIHTSAGATFDDRFGVSCDGLGDVNGNGTRDYIVGAPGHDSPFIAGGEARVVGTGFSCPAPANYCTATANSTGLPAVIGHTGTTSVASNNLVLTAAQCPPNTFGIFIMSATQGTTPLGNGIRCVGDPFFRIGLVNCSPAGTCSLPLDQTGFGPPVSIVPGAVYNFQFWFRNNAAGGGNSNLTNGLSVTFCQ